MHHMTMEKITIDKALLTRFRTNDADHPLTMEELKTLHDFYFEIERRVNILGPDFYLAKKELDRCLVRVRWLTDALKAK